MLVSPQGRRPQGRSRTALHDPATPAHGGDRRWAAARYGLPAEAFLDLSQNVSFTGPPPPVLAAMAGALERVARYPEPHGTSLGEAFARRLGVPAASVLVGNGASELIYLLAAALCSFPGQAPPGGNPPAVVPPVRPFLVPTPTFGGYRRALAAFGLEVRSVPLPDARDFALPVEAVRAALRESAGLFLCNPNNPTGRLEDRQAILSLADEASRHGAWLVVDESFLDFVPGAEELSLAPEAARRPNLVVLRSLTKVYALPGARLGLAVGPPALLEAMRARRDPWSVNVFAQAAGHALAAAPPDLAPLRAQVAAAREALSRGLSATGALRPRPSATNFLFVEVVAPGWTAPALVDALGREGVLVRDCRSFGPVGQRFFRTAVGDPPANARLLRILQRLVAGGAP